MILGFSYQTIGVAFFAVLAVLVLFVDPAAVLAFVRAKLAPKHADPITPVPLLNKLDPTEAVMDAYQACRMAGLDQACDQIAAALRIVLDQRGGDVAD